MDEPGDTPNSSSVQQMKTEDVDTWVESLNPFMGTKSDMSELKATEPSAVGRNGIQESDSEGEGAFDLLASRRKGKKKKVKSKAAKPIAVSITSLPPESEMAKTVDGEPNEAAIPQNIRGLEYLLEEEEICYQFDVEEEDLSDDPVDESLMTANAEETLKHEEAAILAEKQADARKLQSYLKAKWDERTRDVQNQVDKLRAEMLAKQERQRAQLRESHKNQLLEDQQRMEEGMAWLKREQRRELDMKMKSHPQAGGNQDNIIELNNLVTSLQARHDEQIKQFQEKKFDLRKKSEKELRAQSMILSSHHEKRQGEANRHIQNTLAKKCLDNQEHLREKLLRLHEERYERKLAELRSKRLNQEAKSSEAGAAVHTEADEDPRSICHHAVTRHKRRKVSTNNASFGMSIEVHNEGVIIMTKDADYKSSEEHKSSDEHSTGGPAQRASNNVFVPWGAKARKLLHTVMCGEIPSLPEIDTQNLHCSGKQDLDGGMVRCMITDMRTSEDTAICHRAEAYIDHLMSKQGEQIEELNKQRADLSTTSGLTIVGHPF